LLYMPRADCCTEFRPLKVPTNHENLVFNEWKWKQYNTSNYSKIKL
jgi:hypothetical protein